MGKGANAVSSLFHLAGDYNAQSFTHKFCVKNAKDDPADAPNFDRGRYCILKHKDADCPPGI